LFPKFGPGDGGALQGFVADIKSQQAYYSDMKATPKAIIIDFNLIPDDSRSVMLFRDGRLVFVFRSTIMNRLIPLDASKLVASLKNGIDFGYQTQNGPVDNTSQAWDHYMNGNGVPVDIGLNSIQALVNSTGFQQRHQRIITGKTTAMDGHFAVDMTSTVFHIGRTNVDYSIQCSGGDCYLKYTLFRGDGFWDVDFVDENILGRLGIEKYQPDGPGPNLERLGGTPYKYNTTTSGFYFTDPGYKK